MAFGLLGHPKPVTVTPSGAGECQVLLQDSRITPSPLLLKELVFWKNLFNSPQPSHLVGNWYDYQAHGWPICGKEEKMKNEVYLKSVYLKLTQGGKMKEEIDLSSYGRISLVSLSEPRNF